MTTPNARAPFAEQNSQMAQLFATLSPLVQESILQSGVQLSSAEDMQKYADNLTRPV